MHDPILMYLILSLRKLSNANTGQKIAKSVNCKGMVKALIYDSFELYSLRCMHESSFMALPLIVSEKMTLMQKLVKGSCHHCH